MKPVKVAKQDFARELHLLTIRVTVVMLCGGETEGDLLSMHC